MKDNSLKIILSIILIVVIVVSGIYVYNDKNKYTILKEEAFAGKLYQDLQINDEVVKYTDTVTFREMLDGGNFKFNETIRVGDVFITVEKPCYVNGFVDTEYITLTGGKKKHDSKYARFFVQIVNNSSEEILFTEESFVMGYENDIMLETPLTDNSYWGKVENSFGLSKLEAYTRRTGYIYFPINETKLKDLYLKVGVGDIPVIFTK